MVKQQLTIGQLYPKQMNVYGDMGNVITLRYRLEARGIGFQYLAVDSLETLQNNQVDILIGGGGQDSNQEGVHEDLMRYKRELIAQCDDGLTALMICGMYQLFGNRFVLPDAREIPGVGIIDCETHAGNDRLIGNIIIDSPFGELVGFENHSGRTYLGPEVKPLGKVVKGSGNNGGTPDEGAIVKNVFGSYMHGPALAKNPQLADELIHRALQRRYGNKELSLLDNSLEELAAQYATVRPR